VDPAVAQIENVFLYDVDDLQTVAAQATARRRDEIPAAERIVEEETDFFWAWYGGLGVVPTIKELRSRMEEIRIAELERALRQLPHLDPETRARVEQLSQSLLNKFLHQPTVALKAAAEEGRGYGLLQALRRLFGMEPPE
jgi:glutamyl-tRNA reductase